MKLLEYFKEFLANEVNLNESRIAILDQRVEAITNFLSRSDTFKDHFLDVIPQGSYAHKTIIKPVKDGNEFDADVLISVTEFEDWAPKDYVEELYKAFHGSGTYKNMVSRKTRCVKVDYAGDFHVDVVPYLERHGDGYVTNRHEDRFELSDPEGFNVWLDEKNRVTSRHLVKVIRLVKYLRDYKGRFAVKSIILNTLIGDRVNDAVLHADGDAFKDVPTALRTVMIRLNEYVLANTTMPAIADPSGTGELFSDRWHQDGYANFRKWINYYTEKIQEAYSESDKAASLKKWQVVFGDQFKAPAAIVKMSTDLVRMPQSTALAIRDTEQNLSDIGVAEQIALRYSVRLVGRVLRKNGFRDYNLSANGNRVLAGRSIQFRVDKCNVPEPYDIFWKVKNQGPEAIARDCIRGQVERGNSVWRITETTTFRGDHFVECYVVKNGVCVAKDRQDVTII